METLRHSIILQHAAMNQEPMSLLEELGECVADAKYRRAEEITRQGLAAGIAPMDLLRDGLLAGMSDVALRFAEEEIFLPEVIACAKAMKAGLAVLRPLLTAVQAQGLGRVILGTVQGDVHDIGRHIVGMMLEGAGYEVIDVGCDVKPSKFVELVRDLQPQVLGLSALLTTTTPYMQVTIDALKEAGLVGQLIIGVGGASVTQDFADKIGADFYGQNATDALEKVNRLLGRQVQQHAAPGDQAVSP